MTRPDSRSRRAVDAAVATASGLGLDVDDAVVLSDSNRMVVRLRPCDTVVRVSPVSHFASAEQEAELARRLGAAGGPIAPLDPRVEPKVHRNDGFQLTFWQSFDLVPPRRVPADDYARVLTELHGGLRLVDLPASHFTDRITATEADVADRVVTPDLSPGDRALLSETLSDLHRRVVARRPREQLLHGEPHATNILDTVDGLRVIDFENTTIGPIEYDLAWVPAAVTEHYPDVDGELLDECRGLVIAIIAMHRWSRGDRHPSGRESGVAFVDALRAGPPWPAIDDVTW